MRKQNMDMRGYPELTCTGGYAPGYDTSWQGQIDGFLTQKMLNLFMPSEGVIHANFAKKRYQIRNEHLFKGDNW